MSEREWKEQALKIGQHIVDVYGAEVEDVEINEKGNIVVYADECGDKFYCEITPRDWSNYAKECGAI